MNDYLYHHGIKGQKWGIRRFQNKDGSLKPAGERRYNGGLQPVKSKSGIGKKIAIGVGVGLAAGAAAYALANPKSRAFLKKVATASVSKLKAAATDPKVREFIKTNGTKSLKFIGEKTKEVGKAMTDAAVASVGAIAIARVANNLNTGNSELDQLVLDTSTAGIKTLTNANTNSGNQNGGKSRTPKRDFVDAVGKPSGKGVDRQGQEWANLFKAPDGSNRSNDVKKDIREMANEGFDMAQINDYLRKLDAGQIKHGDFYTDELYHHGIKGMKWGVRRYRNYDGSYTKRGLDHYRQTEADYNEANSNYKIAKSAYKQTKKYGSATINGTKVAVSKNVVKEAKAERKRQKERLSKNYDQLKKDYLGDKGKELYKSGKTITGNANKVKIAGLIATGTGVVAKYLSDSGQKDYAKYAIYAGAGMEAVTLALMAKGAVQDRYLRAYYGHSAKYA